MTSLSIVVPFYGVEAYIAECLDSLRRQTLTDFEVILVDDGSPDGSRAIVEGYAQLDPRFKLFVQENQGQGPARNYGISQASGEYLAFVDSDDLVAPRAYSLLVDTLERTGSAFAAANARRFSSAEGTRQSWTHREAFATTRLATSIREFPPLMMDRMMWNKVYRRSFWDAGGYEFPPIRYEDYPVALQAHLDAEAVDVLDTPVYFWRDRVSGDSTTQQVFKPGNARDRVTSAHMVLDMLTGSVPAEVVDRVHAVFIDVDLVALAGAIEQAPEQYTAELVELTIGLARCLTPQPGSVSRLAHLVHKALLRNDIELVRALSRWREGGGTKNLVRDLAQGSHIHQIGPVVNAITPRRRVPNPVRPRKLKTELVSSQVVGDDLHLRLSLLLRRQFAARATGRVDLLGEGWKQRLDAKYRVVPEGLELDVVAPASALSGRPDPLSTLQVSLSVGTLRWQSQVKLPVDVVPPLWQVGPDRYIQVGRVEQSWFLWFLPVSDPVEITGLTARDGIFRIELAEPAGQLHVVLPYPTADLMLPITDGVAELDPAELLRIDCPDDPVTRTAVRVLGYRSVDAGRKPYYRGTFEASSPDPGNYVLPVPDWTQITRMYMSAPALTLPVGGDMQVTIGPNAEGEIVLTHGPVPVEEDAEDA